MRTQLNLTQSKLELQQSENAILRKKLDDLWDKYEEEKDVVMMVTKQEVEKVKDNEIKELKTRLEASDMEIQNNEK